MTEVSSQDAVDNLICDITRSRDANVPGDAEYKRIGLNNIDYVWGISVTGVPIWQALSYDGVDPFNPAIYGLVNDLNSARKNVDKCMMRSEISGFF